MASRSTLRLALVLPLLAAPPLAHREAVANAKTVGIPLVPVVVSGRPMILQRG